MNEGEVKQTIDHQ